MKCLHNIFLGVFAPLCARISTRTGHREGILLSVTRLFRFSFRVMLVIRAEPHVSLQVESDFNQDWNGPVNVNKASRCQISAVVGL